MASRGPLAHPPQYHIRGMLIAVRVLSVLDKIPAKLPTFVPDRLLPEGKGAYAFKSIASPPNRQPFVESRQEGPKIHTPYHADAAHPTINIVGSKCANGYRALVVDDSAAIQKSLELKLTALEEIIAVDLADSGESALEKTETTQYDLIFLDVMMPGIDGYETCSRLRKKAAYKKTPIIMVSGKTSPLDEVKGVIAGCTTHLTKPVQDDAFRKLSGRILVWLANYQRAEKLSH